MIQFKLFISKRHPCACGAIIFLGLWKRLRRKIFGVVARALAAQLLWLALPTSAQSITPRDLANFCENFIFSPILGL